MTDPGPLYYHFNNFGHGEVFVACTKDFPTVVGRSCVVFYWLATGRRWAAMVGDSRTMVFSGLLKVFTGL